MALGRASRPAWPSRSGQPVLQSDAPAELDLRLRARASWPVVSRWHVQRPVRADEAAVGAAERASPTRRDRRSSDAARSAARRLAISRSARPSRGREVRTVAVSPVRGPDPLSLRAVRPRAPTPSARSSSPHRRRPTHHADLPP